MRAFLDNVERSAVPSPKTQRTRKADDNSQKVTSRIVELRDKGSSKPSFGSIARKVNSEMGKRLDKEFTAGAVRQRYEAHKKKATRGTVSSRDV